MPQTSGWTRFPLSWDGLESGETPSVWKVANPHQYGTVFQNPSEFGQFTTELASGSWIHDVCQSYCAIELCRKDTRTAIRIYNPQWLHSSHQPAAMETHGRMDIFFAGTIIDINEDCHWHAWKPECRISCYWDSNGLLYNMANDPNV